jgi:hypothetical protein
MHARDFISIARRDAEIAEGAIAALVVIGFLSLAIGAAVLDVARLLANVH